MTPDQIDELITEAYKRGWEDAVKALISRNNLVQGRDQTFVKHIK